MLQSGEQIDIWVVERALGQGGMGSVYRCHNSSARRILAAVKVLDGALNRVPTAKARFVREAEILFGLDHPNIVKVRNVRMDVDTPYLEMEFVEGESLEGRIHQSPLAVDDALAIFKQVVDAVVYLHEQGIRHRDIKPSNLLVQPNGVVKLVDFGIATESDGATITQSGQACGSVSYAPPEWATPDQLDPIRWDVYSMGVVFYECLTGRLAFPMHGEGSYAQLAMSVMLAKRGHPPLDPGPTFPVPLRALVRRMTQSDMGRRIGSAAEVRAELEQLDLQAVDPGHRFADGPVPGGTMTWVPGLPQGPTSPTMVPGAELLGDSGTLESTFERVETDDVEPAGEAREAEEVAAPRPVSIPEAKGRGPGPLLAVAAVAVVGLGAVAWWSTREPPVPAVEARPLDLAVTGLSADAPVAITLDGAAPTARDGMVFHMGEYSHGSHELVAVVGRECGAETAAWCIESRTTVDVLAGSGAQTVALALAAPEPRDVAVSAPRLAEAEAAVVVLGQRDPVELAGGRAHIAGVAPGSYPLRVDAGSCREEDHGCDGTEAGCPVGCVSWKSTFVVSVGEGDMPMVVDLQAPHLPDKPAVAIQAQGDNAVADKPTLPDKAPAGGASEGSEAGQVVTNSQFARWLASHSEWLRDEATGRGRASGSYLQGWEGAEPPPGKAQQAATNVSWYAAQAFCSGRGGLAGVDAEPLTWTEGASSPWHEYRQQDKAPAWRRSDGKVSTAVNVAEAAPYIGFRCAR